MRRLVPRTGRSAALAACLLLTIVAPVQATDYRGGDTVRIDAGETISGDLYATGRSVIINGTVEGDLIAAAATIEINGEVGGSVDAAGGSVSLGGSVGGSARVAAGDVTVSGSVGRDLGVYGGSLYVEVRGEVSGDLGGAVGLVEIDGTIGGDVIAGSDELRINGEVVGDLDVETASLRIGPTARVGGDVRYTSPAEGEIDDSAALGGVVQRTEPAVAGPDSFLPDHPVVSFVGLTLGLLMLGWLMLWIRPMPTAAIGHELRARPLLVVGAGLAGWIAQLLVVLVLVLISVLLSQIADALGGAVLFIAVIAGLLVVTVALVAQVYVSLGVGELVAHVTRAPPRLGLVLGVVVVAALLTAAGTFHWVAGMLLHLVVWMLGLGAFLLYHARRRIVERELATAARMVASSSPVASAVAIEPLTAPRGRRGSRVAASPSVSPAPTTAAPGSTPARARAQAATNAASSDPAARSPATRRRLGRERG